MNSILLQGDVYESSLFSNGESYTFEISDQNGCLAPGIFGAHNCNCLSAAGSMSTDTLQACVGQTVQAVYQGGAQLDGNDSLSFVLHTLSGNQLGQVLAQNRSGLFEIQAGMTPGVVYFISAVVGNALPGGGPALSDPCLAVSKGQAIVFYPIPVANAGVDVAGCGDTLTLSAQNPNGAWVLTGMPAGGVAQLETSNAPSTIVVTNQPGTYTFDWLVSEHGCSDSDQVEAKFYSIPEVSSIEVVCDASNENYQVAFTIQGGAPAYTVNNSVLPGDLFSSNNIPNNDSYTFVIADSHGCEAPAVAGTHTCNCMTEAGKMDTTLITACASDSIQVFTVVDPKIDANDVVTYVLHTNPGTALGQILAQNKTGKFGLLASMNLGQTYYVSRLAGNELNGVPDPEDPCLALSPGQPIRFLQVPAPALGADLATCGFSLELKADSTMFPGSWKQVSGPAAANLSAFANFVTQASVSKAGEYVFRYTASNGICSGFDEVLAKFNEVPVLSGLTVNCDDTNTGYLVLFSISNGLPPFVVDGLNGLLAGNSFLSTPLLNNSDFSFSVTDANGCQSVPVSGSKNCQCATNAGSMSAVAAVFCAGQTATAAWNNDGNLDGDDVLEFVLHDQPGTQLGNILGINSKPEFAFSAGLSTGVMYYISAVVGNNAGGQVDLSDPCLSVSPGLPVQWKTLPTAMLAAPSQLCAGQVAELQFSGTGDFPLTVTYTLSTGGQSSIILPDIQTLVLPVMPGSTTTYFLNSVTDGSQPNCLAPLDSFHTIQVQEPARAGESVGTKEVCAGTAATVYLAELLAGLDLGGVWTEVSSILSPKGFDSAKGSFDIQQQQAGLYQFQYTIQSAAPCPADTSQVSIQVHPLPLADAGPNLELSCSQPEVVLGGAGSSIGADIMYSWVRNGLPLLGANSATFTVDAPGEYWLLVENEFGCQRSDTVGVTQLGNMINAPVIRVVPVRCFGEKNGGIFVDTVFGGTAPYQFSLNGLPLGQKMDFSPLPPGTYTLLMQDAEGCEWSSGPILLPEPAATKISLGADIEAALGDSVYLLLETTLPAIATDTIIWQPLLDSSAAGQPFQTFLALHSGKIQVTVLDTNGCQEQDELVLQVNRKRNLFFPNAFSPNSLENNVFLIFGGRDVGEVEHLEIFDRWGERVFAAHHFPASDKNYGWDGRLNGKELDPGVFVFQVAVLFKDGERERFSGSITLLR
ncbi:MAG: gliding motility-associated C-terminal domain-containing protein [Saprospiraceae bacterium]|nr:gliding motility-associated C-terminal domain-containing protein [Saprospiraceae bacterium]